MSAISPASAWAKANQAQVRVLTVDDSAVMRSLVARMLEPYSDINLLCATGSASEALSFLADNAVDIVLLDHEMPGRKGLDALPEIIEAARGAHVLMLSSHCQRGSKTAVAAMSLGASDAIAKPMRGHTAAYAEALVPRLRQMGASRRFRTLKDAPSPVIFRAFPRDFRPQCIAIGASTGGIHTLGELLAGLHGVPDAPILVTQHLPEPFTPYYAQQVARMSDLPVSVASSGDILVPGHIYIAPGTHSLSCVRQGTIVRANLIADRDPETLSLPSVNRMFSGVADSYGAGALGIVLTGIGRDGTAGARKIVAAGGAIIAQDRESSVVWGMPGSVSRAGLASANLRPEHIFGYVRAQCGGGA